VEASPTDRDRHRSALVGDDLEQRWSPSRRTRRIARFEARWGPIATGAVGFVGCGGALAIAGIVAWLTHLPWIFPSLAPTALLVFETPLRPQASPRHTLVGHGVAIVTGYASLLAFGLQSAPSVTVAGVTPARIGATALAVGATTFFLHAVRSAHPPAGATALIVSLGIMRTGVDLGVLAGAVLLVTALGWGFNRAVGIDVPVWSARHAPGAEAPATRTDPSSPRS
jgi:CBS-domain-containing membrane protein